MQHNLSYTKRLRVVERNASAYDEGDFFHTPLIAKELTCNCLHEKSNRSAYEPIRVFPLDLLMTSTPVFKLTLSANATEEAAQALRPALCFLPPRFTGLYSRHST